MDLGPVKTPWERRAVSVLDWTAVAVAGAVGLSWVLGSAPAGLAVWVAIAALFVAFLGRRILGPLASARQLRGLKAIGFRVCPRCQYDLRAQEEDGDCPECGEPFDARTLEREWRWCLGTMRRF